MCLARFFVSVVAITLLSNVLAASDEPTLSQRLQRLEETLEAARGEAHIPGMSIAIVKDDEIVWARGFGVADVENLRPADENTIYGIGSTTKAFTATLIGMLVDEGQANWDDPVTKHLPYFDLQVRSDDENAACTLRDLLSHRHGFVRMGILLLGGRSTRADVLHAAVQAEPWDELRKGFHYTNVMYLAAGQAAGRIADTTWDEMMVERIFQPLGMASSSLSVAEAQKDPRLALGYFWDPDLKQLEREAMLDFGVIGPAGAVNSNVLDMAQWLRLQLGRGTFAGVQMVSPESLLETWEPQIEMGGGASYGMGWMLREHDGRRVVEHGGNVDGFSAQVGLMPEENLGYVLLMNLGVSPLRQASLAMVFDALLEEWPEEQAPSERAEVEFDDFIGTYVANFAKFRDAHFEVLVKGDNLALSVPNQGTLDLRLPDGEGVWSAVQTKQVKVSFDRDAQGAVVALRMHLNGFRFEVPRQGHETALDTPAGQFDEYVGSYARVSGGKRVELLVKRGRLIMLDKGQYLAFGALDSEGHAPLQARADFGATFERDAEGNVEAFVFHGSSGDKVFKRLVDGQREGFLDLEELLALRQTGRRIAAFKEAGGTKTTAEISYPNAGLRGTLTTFTQGRDRHASHMDFGKFGKVSTAMMGGEAWQYYPLRGLRRLQGAELMDALLEHPGVVDGDWRDHFDSIEVIGNDTLNGRAVHVVRLQKAGLPSRTFRVDAENGDVLQVKKIEIEHQSRVPVTVTYGEFKEMDGLRRPMRMDIENPASGRTVVTIDKIESGLDLSDEVFVQQAPDGDEGNSK